jgi:hypothetical protein
VSYTNFSKLSYKSKPYSPFSKGGWGDRLFRKRSWGESSPLVKGASVRSQRSGELMWSQALDPDQRSIVYGEEGKPLQPGQAYYWRLLRAESSQNSLPRIMFRVMEQGEERETIVAELAQIRGETIEDTAIARANYFADRELWSDALRELYAVENPSEELLAIVEQIQGKDFCNLADAP